MRLRRREEVGMKNQTAHMNNQSLGRTLRLVMQTQRITKPDIAVQLGVSLPTASQNVRLLMEHGLLAYDGTAESTGGRKAQTVVPVPEARVALGLDITANQVRGVLVNLQGAELASFTHTLAFSNTDGYFAELSEKTQMFLQSNRIEKARLLGTGISIPGVLSADGRMLVRSHVLQVEHLPTAAFFDHLWGACAICNDAKAAAIAELWQWNDLGTAAYLSLSESVGGALVIDNRIYEGAHCRGGEFGHMTLVPDGRRCYCGQYGCLDAYCNATVLAGQAESLAAFFGALEEGEPACVRVWHRYAEHLAMAINSIVTMLDCPVILGGLVGAQMSRNLLQELLQRVQERATFEIQENQLLLCRHRHNTAAVGGALQLVHSFLQTGYQTLFETERVTNSRRQ